MSDGGAAAGRTVGLFGGTFDPVHDAHLALARAALHALSLDELLWIPTGQPWHKAGRAVTPAAHRAAMVALAIAGEPRFVLDTLEIDRAGPSYTVDTVRALSSRRPGTRWVLLLGGDQFARLSTWHEWQALAAMVTFAVALRPGAEPAADPRVRSLPFATVPMPPTDLSASDIRHRIRAGLDIAGMVPPAVARYIEEHRLYRGGAEEDRS